MITMNMMTQKIEEKFELLNIQAKLIEVSSCEVRHSFLHSTPSTIKKSEPHEKVFH